VECVYSFIAGPIGRTGISHFVVHLALKVRNVVPGLAIPEKIRNLDALLRHAAMPGKQLFSQILGIRGWHPPLVHRHGQPKMRCLFRNVNVSDYGERTARCLLMLFDSI